ncbi:MAG: Coq4 family protein [Myxococcota bacterium]
MKKIEAFRAFRAAIKDPNRLGDAAIYKSEIGGARARPEIEAQIANLETTFPDVEVEPLLELPRGTVGREYAELLRANGLDPFRISEQLPRDVLRRNIFIARYALLHDVYHVLTGFDTSWAGEAGVWGFVAGQRYLWTYWINVIMTCVIYPLLAPWQTLRIWRNAIRGVRMGRRAATLIAMPIETMWARPVTELRVTHRIEASDDLAIPKVAPLSAA